MTLPAPIVADEEMRGRISALESAMKKLPQADLEPRHHFANGMYARELFMPAGSVVTSKIHKTEHFALIVSGRVTVVQEDGTREIQAPYLTITKPGTKRALYVHEDTVWITFHPTDKTNVDEIEKDIIAEDFNDKDLIEMREQKWLG